MNRTTVFMTSCLVGAFSMAGVLACENSPTAESLDARPRMTAASTDFVSCPVSEWQVAWGLIVPHKGGTVEVESGGIMVPPGAVERPTFIMVLAPKGPHPVLDIRANGLEHFQFEKPVEITFDYSRCADAVEQAGSVEAWEVDSETHDPIAPVPGDIDTEAAEYTIWPDHLTSYTLVTN